MAADPWDLLRNGQMGEGLRLLREAEAREPDASHIIEHGVALLWAREYGAAWEHFRDAGATYPRRLSVFSNMAGVAKWCLGEYGRAVEQWRAGLRAGYADTGGAGVKSPLLLFCASVLNPSAVDKSEPLALLLKKSDDPRLRYWPGPLAKFVVGQIAEGGLRGRCAGVTPSGTRSNQWHADFYVGLLELDRGNRRRFEEMMSAMVAATEGEGADRQFFLNCLWTEEFFLARHEARGASRS